MNEPRFGDQVRQILNQGAQLDDKLLSRLRAARAQALERQRFEVPEGAAVLAGRLPGGFSSLSFRVILPLVVLLGGLTAISGWQKNLRVAEVAEIDALLLTDELPLDAFLDKGFEAWLKKQKRSPL